MKIRITAPGRSVALDIENQEVAEAVFSRLNIMLFGLSKEYLGKEKQHIIHEPSPIKREVTKNTVVQSTLEEEEEDVELLDMIPDIEDKFAIVEEVDWLKRGMCRLNEKERRVLKANLQYQGVAQDKKCVLLGISQSYYSRIMRSARNKILN